MNDRLAFMKTNIKMSHSQWGISETKKIPKENFHYNFFSSNSCNLVTATYRKKYNCPLGYVICKYNDFNGSLKLMETKMTFDEAKIQCQNLNSTICKISETLTCPG